MSRRSRGSRTDKATGLRAVMGGTVQLMMRTALSRADLVRLAVDLDDTELSRLAQGLGYREVESLEGPGDTVTGPDTSQPAVPPVAPTAAREQHRAYSLAERHLLAPLQGRIEPPKRALDPRQAEPDPLPPPPPLVPWSRLWPLLRAALSLLGERQRIDMTRLVAAQARLRPLRRLPRLRAARWAPVGQLILDLSPRLYPFRADFAEIKSMIPRLRGRTGLEILGMEQGPEGPVRDWDGADWGEPRPYRCPAADVPVLIAGDLGCLGPPSERQAWVRLGRRLRASGRQAVALTPCPSRWWDPALAGLYFPVVLDRAAHVPARAVGARPWPDQAVDLQAAIAEDPGARRLLALLAACLAISPALLRHLRHRLPAGAADVGSEAAAWQHPTRLAGALALLPGDPAESERLWRAHSDRLGADERQLAWDLIRAQQSALRLSRAVRMEERMRQAALLGGTDDQAEAFQDQVAEALETARDMGDWEQAAFLTGWVGRLGTRMYPDAWDFSPRSEALWLLAHPEATTEGTRLPSGLDIHRALAAQKRSESMRVWRVVQRGERLEITSEGAQGAIMFIGSPSAGRVFLGPAPKAQSDRFLSGSLVAGRLYTRDPVAQVRENRPAAPTLSLPLRDSASLPLNEHGWRIRTEHEELVIAPFERPAWAHTLGRDHDGLFVGFNDGRGDRRAYWCGPDHGQPEWLKATGRPSGTDLALADLHIEPGFFMDQAQLQRFRQEGFHPAAVGSSIRIDDYGVRGEIHIRGVTIGLRWIWPGQFLMGSPMDEKGRIDDETQHEVILTRGFWLAETACTQALWEAVMGQKPSPDKKAAHPVVNPSWNDVQRFLERLNEDLAVTKVTEASSLFDQSLTQTGSGALASIVLDSEPLVIRFRLPTEAEWEYACRAGTTSAYSFGDAFDAKHANDQFSTVEVRSFPPNPWGLYEMHGNVWEWCQDWHGDYAREAVVDPAGPATGETRVLRGGSWFDVARGLRSACRFRVVPGYRRRDFGFRLALGPEVGKAGGVKLAGSARKPPTVRSREASRRSRH